MVHPVLQVRLAYLDSRLTCLRIRTMEYRTRRRLVEHLEGDHHQTIMETEGGSLDREVHRVLLDHRDRKEFRDHEASQESLDKLALLGPEDHPVHQEFLEKMESRARTVIKGRPE